MLHFPYIPRLSKTRKTSGANSRPRPLADPPALLRDARIITVRSHQPNNVWTGGDWDGFQVQALLEELQAEPDTAISLPELTEIIALLLA